MVLILVWHPGRGSLIRQQQLRWTYHDTLAPGHLPEFPSLQDPFVTRGLAVFLFVRGRILEALRADRAEEVEVRQK